MNTKRSTLQPTPEQRKERFEDAIRMMLEAIRKWQEKKKRQRIEKKQEPKPS